MRQRLLIIDDEQPIRFALARYFGALGCVVETAGTVAEAERLIESASYQAAIIDVRLAWGREGLALAHLMRSHHPEAKLVMLTAYGSPDLEAEARAQGADVVLSKPQPLADIAAVLGALLGAPLGAGDSEVCAVATAATREPTS